MARDGAFIPKDAWGPNTKRKDKNVTIFTVSLAEFIHLWLHTDM